MPRKIDLDPTAKVQARLDRDRKKYDGETTPLYDKLDKKYHPESVKVEKQMYYYVFGWTKKGKKLIDGPFTTVQEADTLAATVFEGEIFEKATKDQARATREIKAELLARGEEPDAALERVKHALPKGEGKAK